ncbi:MAG: glutamate mutase L [Bacillota bacterium]
MSDLIDEMLGGTSVGERHEGEVVLAIELGQAVTKVGLFETGPDGWKLTATGSALTTSQAPWREAGLGIQTALADLSEGLERPLTGRERVIACTRASGGLRAAVAGVIRTMTAESAWRAALNAGAEVVDVFSLDDRRLPVQQAMDFRRSNIDLLLLAGGIDEDLFAHGRGHQVVTEAGTLAGALPPSRLRPGAPLPVVFAGSSEARDLVAEAFKGRPATLSLTENVRPDLDREVLEPAGRTLVDLYRGELLESPAFRGLAALNPAPLVPTGLAVGQAVKSFALAHGHGSTPANVLAVDVGAAGVDLHMVMSGTYTRSSTRGSGPQNEATLAARIARWLPYAVDPAKALDHVAGRRVHPAAVAETWPELLLDLAEAREAMAVALEVHKQVAVTLRGIPRRRTIGEALGRYLSIGGQTVVDLSRIDHVIGLGGPLTASPQAAMLALIDGLQPAGITRLSLDADGSWPWRGLLGLAGLDGRAVVPLALGTWIAPPPAAGVSREGRALADVEVRQGSWTSTKAMVAGELRAIRPPKDGTATVIVHPKGMADYGAGPSRAVQAEVEAGRFGVILDGRGRPMIMPVNEARRQARVREWMKGIGDWPEAALAGGGEAR